MLPWRTVASCFVNSILWSTAAVHIPASTVGGRQLHSARWCGQQRRPTEDLIRLSKPKSEFVHGHELFIRLCAFFPHFRPISPRKRRKRKRRPDPSANVERNLLLLPANFPPCLVDSSLEVHNGSTSQTHFTGAEQRRARRKPQDERLA